MVQRAVPELLIVGIFLIGKRDPPFTWIRTHGVNIYVFKTPGNGNQGLQRVQECIGLLFMENLVKSVVEFASLFRVKFLSRRDDD
jgi:hypothetical protein